MILVINSGSSSLKFKLFDLQLKELAEGNIERIGLDKKFPDHAAGLKFVLQQLKEKEIEASDIRAVGHRVVHGGEEFVQPTLLTTSTITRLKKYNKLAPLHNPPNLMGIEAAMKLFPKAKNVAVFDTAFYQTLPAHAYLYSLPYELYTKHHVRKYGFHGISHAYVASEAAKKLKKPLAKISLITCHLGSGASVTAIKNGKAIDTSMGFTPLEGLTMSTRCGDIDPEIPLWLIRELKMTPTEVDALMNKKSGLLGLSGHKDMRDAIAAAEKGDKRSKLAIDIFTYDVARYIGQFYALLGACDAVVFTAGIGERSPLIRGKILVWLKALKLKPLVIATNEELMIAKQSKKLLKLA